MDREHVSDEGLADLAENDVAMNVLRIKSKLYGTDDRPIGGVTPGYRRDGAQS